MPYTRQTASPWFFPLGFLGLFPKPPFPRMPRLLAARQKETASETTIRGQNPSAQVFALKGKAAKGINAFLGRLLASPLLAVCLPVFWVLGCCCRCGSVRWCGFARQGRCARLTSSTSALLIVASFVFVKGEASAYAPLTKTLFWCVSPINWTVKHNVCRAS